MRHAYTIHIITFCIEFAFKLLHLSAAHFKIVFRKISNVYSGRTQAKESYMVLVTEVKGNGLTGKLKVTFLKCSYSNRFAPDIVLYLCHLLY